MCPPYILDGTYVHKNFAANDFKQLTEEEESQVTQFRASIFTIWNFLI